MIIKVSDTQIKNWLEIDSKGAYLAAQKKAKELNISSDNTDFIYALTSVNFQCGTNWNLVHAKHYGCYNDYDALNFPYTLGQLLVSFYINLSFITTSAVD